MSDEHTTPVYDPEDPVEDYEPLPFEDEGNDDTGQEDPS